MIDEKRRALEAAPVPAPALPTGAMPAYEHADEHAYEQTDSGHDGEGSVTSSMAQLNRAAEMQQLRAMLLQQELLVCEAEDCTFHPRTNSRSGAHSKSKVEDPEAFFNYTKDW